MAIAACLTLGIIHAQIALRLRARARAAHAFFTLSATAVAVTGSIELVLLFTRDLQTYQQLMLFAELPLWLMVISLAGFTWNFFGTGRKSLAVVTVALMTAVAVANMLVPSHMTIRYASAIRTIHTFGGVEITLATMENGVLTIGEVLAVLLLLVFVVDASIGAWRQGDRRRAFMVGGSIVFSQLGSRTYALMVEAGHLHTPFFFIFPFLALLLAMGLELSLDVFRAVQLADQLRESEQKIDLAARAATLGFWVWDVGRDDLWANAGARSLFGVEPDEPLNFARFEETVHPDDRDTVRKAVEHSLATGEDYEAEYRIRSGVAPERWIVARGRVAKGLAETNGTLMRGVVIDVTERKRAQFEADGLRRELAHVTRVSTMGELAASMAHELNQPLAAILSNAQAARRFLAAPDVNMGEIRDILDDIVADDKRAGEVIHRLRALVQKREHVDAEPVDLNELVRDAARLLHSERIGRNVDLVTVHAPDLPLALANRVEIQQVLLNLMVNAMDAMRDQPAETRTLTIETSCGRGVACAVVRDTGPGVPAAILPDIFRPFFTTKQHGLGMGLAISRTILEAYGGRLSVENAASGGAQFRIELRLARDTTRHG